MPTLTLAPFDRVMLLGGGPVLAEVARRQTAAGAEVVVVTSPRHAAERPAPAEPSLLDALGKAGVLVVVTEDVGADARVRALVKPATLGLSFGAAWIFRRPWIDLFGGRLLNSHGTRLPRDRGGGGFSWQILMGHRHGCCLLHQVDEGVDTGPIVLRREFTFPPSCRIPRDYQAVHEQESLRFLDDFFRRARSGEAFPLEAQDERRSTYWPRLSTMDHGWIDWSWRALDIERFICAFDEPYAGASTQLAGNRVFLKGCELAVEEEAFHSFQAGLVFRRSSEGMYVAATGGSLVVRRVLDQRGRDVLSEVRVGDRFHTPEDRLEHARTFRAVYTPRGLKAPEGLP